MAELLAHVAGFAPIDRELAAVVVRRAGLSNDVALAVGVAVALLSRARADGHSGLWLADLANQATTLAAPAAQEQEHRATIAWPSLPWGDPSWWRALLSTPPVRGGVVEVDVGAHGIAPADDRTAAAGDAAEPFGTDHDDEVPLAPLTLHGDLLQFRRYRDAERRIGVAIQRRLAAPGTRLGIITGGPGTGKTTRVAQQLVERLGREPDLRVQLAAPTGKAAARVTESLRVALDQAQVAEAVRARMPQDAMTLHRLLKYHAGLDRFRAVRDDRIGADLVVVDEASMVDVLVMDALLQALPERTDLLLVGDHQQLASVDAGDVLGALCRAADDAPDGASLRAAVTRLTSSWRFEAHPGIGVLAEAVLAGDGDQLLERLEGGLGDEVTWCRGLSDHRPVLEAIAAHLEACRLARSPVDLLAALDRFRLLCPEREGPFGVAGLNGAVEGWLRRHGAAVRGEWYHGRPVLVTANDYTVGLFNGDLGVAWEGDGGTLVHFPDGRGGTRALSPGRLPAVQTAWAMTVHKAQGSEFDDVVVVLPPDGSRVASRELLYTAVTRARQRVTLAAGAEALRGAVARSERRSSGLQRWVEGAHHP